MKEKDSHIAFRIRSEIKQIDPKAKVIVLTALDQRSVAARAVQKGAKDFLVKPVITRELLAALQKVLE